MPSPRTVEQPIERDAFVSATAQHGQAIVVLSGYRARMANAADGTCAGSRLPEASGEMAAGIAFLALILTLVFAAVGVVLYVARRFNRS